MSSHPWCWGSDAELADEEGCVNTQSKQLFKTGFDKIVTVDVADESQPGGLRSPILHHFDSLH